MKLDIKNISNSLNKAYLAQCPFVDEINKFKDNYKILFSSVKPTDSEETIKTYINDFLKNTYYQGKFATKVNVNNIDLVILNGKNVDDKIGVIVETKAIKSTEMITNNELNKKSFQELISYYLEERVKYENVEIKHLIITNSIDWFVFNATEFERLFYQNKSFLKKYNDWYNQKLVSKNKDWFYSELAKQFIESEQENIVCTHFQLTENLVDTESSLIELYKIFSPEHLLKLPFKNDSNTLNREFYNEFLHIIGLQETKVNNVRKIERLYEKDRQDGSLIENTINILQTDEILHNINEPERFGETYEEQLFSIGLELCITWLNRILFLKLLESQLVKYNNSNKEYLFLNSTKIRDFEELKELFFEVLAIKPSERKKQLQTKYEKIPYLNSSLFEQTVLEKETVKINQLKNHYELPIFNTTVLKDDNGKRLTGTKPILQYIFDFLESYNFASDNKAEIQKKNKTIINSSVLGLIFEKLNGYKDGSFFTPGFITMYLCRETIRNAVIEKFKTEKVLKNVKDFIDLYNKINKIPIKKANEIFNSIKICDPAVGSGHFLVSALNELIAIKSDLGILADSEGKLLRNVTIEIENDELFISVDSELFAYNYKNNESQRIQETIFHEKQTLIENCLFGVDINPKSVNICRLRLWIELLKNSYFTKQSNFKELETLPNIDINIKYGNSLISHFSLNGNANGNANGNSQSLKLYTQKYKKHVSLYKNETDRNAKREYEKQIKLIKEHFAKTVNPKDEDLKKIRKIEGEIGSTPMFFNQDEQVQWKMKHQRLENERVKLQKNYDEKLKTVYSNAFEWRFEFPEVLDENGYFVGFDVIIGNPPYINIFNIDKEYLRNYYKENYTVAKNKTDLYAFFIELSNKLLSKNGYFAFIVSNSWLSTDSFSLFRRYILDNFNINKITELNNKIFAEASVTPILLFMQKQTNKDFTIKIEKFDENTFNFITNVNSATLKTNPNYAFTLKSIINPHIKTICLQEIAKFSLGIKTTDNERFIKDKKENEDCYKYIRGKDINRYSIDYQNKYVWYRPDLMNEKTGAGARKFEHFTREKILIRDVAVDIRATLDTENYLVADTITFIYKLDNKYNNKFILCLLNSKYINYWFKTQFSGGLHIKINQLNYIPIPIISKNEQQPFIELVDKIIDIKKQNPDEDTSKIEQQLDEMIFRLYNLTKDEIILIK